MTDFKKSNELIIGVPLVDWFTVTSWADGDSFQYWQTVLKNHSIDPLPNGDMNVMQYEGQAYDVRNGSLFIGSGLQDGRLHNMVRSGGNVSDQLFDIMCARPVANMWGKCTRLDLQITLPQPDEWSQWRLLWRLKKAGKPAWLRPSNSGYNGRELATVYVGSRHSSRLLRLYQKEGGKNHDMFLRFEVEFKGNRSNQMAGAMHKDRDIIGEYLSYEVQQLGDKRAEALFGTALANYNPRTERVRKVQAQDATESWLLGRVLPSFDRHIKAHDSSDIVLTNFLRVIQERFDQV